MNAGYPNNLFRAISDTPPSPAAMIRNMVISSYIAILFEIAEICHIQILLCTLDLTMNH